LIGALLGLAVIATAAPKLRLSTLAVGPVYIATGQQGTMQSIPATNVGDGNLNLAVTSNVDWLAPCIEDEGQLLVNLMLPTSKLPRGVYTGVATVTDPNAIDAPQSITVTIVVGSGSTIPDQLDFYLPPGGSGIAIFYAGCPSTVITNPSGGLQISVATSVGLNGTFGVGVPCADKDSRVMVTTTPDTVLGDYVGSVAFSGSLLAVDNHTVPVNIHVTTNPVASAVPASVFFRMAQADPKMTQTVSLYGNNLDVSSANANVPWLSATFFPKSPYVNTSTVQSITIVADASKLAPGNYPANVTITSNGANGPTIIPVVLTVLPPGPPVTYYQGVVENALYKANDPVARGGIVALFGERLTAGNVTFAPSLPLSSTLGGASVFVNDVPAPVYFASPGQLNFVVPYGRPPGPALVRVDRDGQRGNLVSFQVVATAPRLLRLDGANDALAVLGDLRTFVVPAHPAKAGVDTVVFYAVGLGQTSPPALDGQAAQGLQRVSSVQAVIGFPIQPAYAGLTPGSVGLYQINVSLPANVPKGSGVPVYLTMPGEVTSNTVYIAIQ
jgi:uncharacterized protein (TIGR03437 family)